MFVPCRTPRDVLLAVRDQAAPALGAELRAACQARSMASRRRGSIVGTLGDHLLPHPEHRLGAPILHAHARGRLGTARRIGAAGAAAAAAPPPAPRPPVILVALHPTLHGARRPGGKPGSTKASRAAMLKRPERSRRPCSKNRIQTNVPLSPGGKNQLVMSFQVQGLGLHRIRDQPSPDPDDLPPALCAGDVDCRHLSREPLGRS